MKTAFGIHGVTQKIWADDPSGRHFTSHSHFWTILHLVHRHFGIVCRPVMAIMSTDETADMEKGLVAAENVFKEFWPIPLPTQHQLPIFHPAVTVFGCQLLHTMGFQQAKFKSFFNTVRTVCLDSPLSRAAWRVDLSELRVNISRTNATFFSDRDVDGRPLLRASVTEPVVRSFE